MAGTSPITLPNLITSAGYGLGLWWALGNGPGWAALASLVLDEVDGAAARALGQESEVGRVYDAEVDTVLAALAANRAWGLDPRDRRGRRRASRSARERDQASVRWPAGPGDPGGPRARVPASGERAAGAAQPVPGRAKEALIAHPW